MDWHSYNPESSAGDLSGAGSEVRVYIERLEHKLNGLGLACQALWEILKENTDLSEAELADRMQEIDLRDGVADGKITHTPLQCPKCHRKSNRRCTHCMYCGAELAFDDETFGRE